MRLLPSLLTRHTSLSSWLFRSPAASAAVLGPWAVWQRLGAAWAPPALPHLATATAHAAAPASSSSSAASSSLSDLLLDGLLLMAVPKKKISYTRKRKKIAGFQALRGPKLKTNLYMCPVCERMRATHRVCGREDCCTYFKHKWF